MLKEELIEVVERHGRAMAADVETILADYSEDAVVITNLADKPLVGHKEIGEFLRTILANPPQVLKGEDILYCHQAYGEEYVLHVFGKQNSEAFGAETYQIRDGKIIFESAYIR